VAAGANMVQGTVNGVGERAGNAPLEEIALALVLHAEEFGKEVTVDPAALHGLSRLVADETGFEPAANKPLVGRNIFRTEAGIHQDGLLQHPDTYLPYRPELVGAGPVEIVLGRNSGRHAVRHHLEAAGFEPTEEHVRLVLAYLKGDHHTAAEMAEIREFLERIRPFMSGEEVQLETPKRLGQVEACSVAEDP